MRTVRRLSRLAAFLAAAALASAAIRLDGFRSTGGLQLAGDAAVVGPVLRLAPAHYNRAGAAWSVEKQPVAAGFETTFQFRLTHQGGLGPGADGFAFVVQNSGPRGLGGRGSAGGFAVADPSFHPREPGIPWSIAVFFDTYRNDDEGDPSSNYIAFRTHGRPAEMRWPADRLAFTRSLPIRLKDRAIHTARIRFQPPVLSVFLDGAPVLQAAVDLGLVVDAQGRAWVGFTASTGGGYQNHDILNWSFAGADVSSNISVVSSDITFLMSECLPDRNLCTPSHAGIESRDTGYHVILPANLEWGASVPNPSERTVTVANPHGMACWDLAARGSQGCSGPSGAITPAGPGFLAADAAPGALIVQTRAGRTWFSVNGRPGPGFHDNQGFYEFDLEVK